jgi:uncharacterized coiled-coil protein SlyX
VINHEALLGLISMLYAQLSEEKKGSAELEKHLRGLLEQLKKQEEEEADNTSNGKAVGKKDTPVGTAS